MRCYAIIFAVMVAIILNPINLFSLGDPGQPDTVKLTGGPLIVGQSVPLNFTIVNDELLGAYSLGFEILCTDSFYLPEFPDLFCPFAVFDSIVYVGRMADPIIFPLRTAGYQNPDQIGDPPDTLIFGAANYGGYNLPEGSTPIAKVYFTGIYSGYFAIDSTYFPPAGGFLLTSSDGRSINPQLHIDDIYIMPGSAVPELTVPQQVQGTVVNEQLTFQVCGESSGGFDVNLSLEKLCGYDDTTRTPSSQPQLSAGNPAEFAWAPGPGDYGIWKAQFKGTDSHGSSPIYEVVIEVVENDSYLLDFDMVEVAGVPNSTSFGHGDFDNDSEMEIFISGTGYYNNLTAELYKRQGNGSWISVYQESAVRFRTGTGHLGFFNDDENLDFLAMQIILPSRKLTYLLGSEDNTFAYAGEQNPGHFTRGSAMGEFSADNYLDIVSVWEDIKIYAGQEGLGFTEYCEIDIDSARAINSADFDNNGRDDLAVGTKTQLKIFLNHGSCYFRNVASYPQVYGSADIEVTNRGSDFNDDDLYDLCISTPSVGLTESEMYVYLGNGDGTFIQNHARTVLGQIFGNCIGDFNGDNYLDIAYVNGARRYAAILFGEGNGQFTNEIRIRIPHHNPNLIDCFDVDRDGDLDLVVLAHGQAGDNSLFVLENTLDPQEFARAGLQIIGCDNAQLELVSQSGRIFNRIKNTMSSGEYYNRNIDGDDDIDDFAQMNVIENGEYVLQAKPKPNEANGKPFDLEYYLNGTKYRLAKDMPMRAEGFEFKIVADDSKTVWPRSGTFGYNQYPIFTWQGSKQYDFQIATDIEFSNIIESAVVDGNQFTVTEALASDDTTTYYWRVKNVQAPNYDMVYVYNYISATLGICGDADGSGIVKVEDVIHLINHVFINGAPPDSFDAGDANCDGGIGVSDAVWIINYLYIGGNPPCDLDGDTEPDC